MFPGSLSLLSRDFPLLQRKKQDTSSLRTNEQLDESMFCAKRRLLRRRTNGEEFIEVKKELDKKKKHHL